MKLNKLLLSTALAVTLNVFESNGAAHSRRLEELGKEARLAAAFKAVCATPEEVRQRFEAAQQREVRHGQELQAVQIEVAARNQEIAALKVRLGAAPAQAAPNVFLGAAFKDLENRAQQRTAFFEAKGEERKEFLQRIQAQELVVAEMKEKLEALVAEKTRALEEATRRFQESQAAKNASEAQRTEFQGRVEEVQRDMAALKDETARQRKTQETGLRQREAELAEVRCQLERITAERDQNSQAIEVLQQEMDRLGQTNAAAKVETEAKIQALQAQLQKAKEEKTVLTSEIQGFSARANQGQAVTAEMEELRTQQLADIAQKEQEIAYLKANVTRMEAEASLKLRGLEEQLLQARATVAQKEEFLLETRQKVAALEESLRQKEETLTTQVQELSQKTQELEAAATQLAELRGENDKSEQSIQQKSVAIAALEKKIAGLEATVTHIKAESQETLGKKTQELESLAKNLKEQESELSLLKVRKKAEDQQVLQQLEELKRLKEDHSHLQESAKKNELETKKLSEQISLRETERKGLLAELESLKVKNAEGVAALEREHEETKAKFSEGQTAMSAVQGSYATEAQRLNEEHTARKKTLQEEIAQMRSELQRSLEDRGVLQEQLKASQHQMAAVRVKQLDRASKAEAHRVHNDPEARRIEELNVKITNIREELSKLKEEKEKEISQLNIKKEKEISQLNGEIEKFKKENKEITKKLVKSRQKLSALKEKVKQLGGSANTSFLDTSGELDRSNLSASFMEEISAVEELQKKREDLDKVKSNLKEALEEIALMQKQKDAQAEKEEELNRKVSRQSQDLAGLIDFKVKFKEEEEKNANLLERNKKLTKIETEYNKERADLEGMLRQNQAEINALHAQIAVLKSRSVKAGIEVENQDAVPEPTSFSYSPAAPSEKKTDPTNLGRGRRGGRCARSATTSISTQTDNQLSEDENVAEPRAAQFSANAALVEDVRSFPPMSPISHPSTAADATDSNSLQIPSNLEILLGDLSVTSTPSGNKPIRLRQKARSLSGEFNAVASVRAGEQMTSRIPVRTKPKPKPLGETNKPATPHVPGNSFGSPEQDKISSSLHEGLNEEMDFSNSENNKVENERSLAASEGEKLEECLAFQSQRELARSPTDEEKHSVDGQRRRLPMIPNPLNTEGHAASPRIEMSTEGASRAPEDGVGPSQDLFSVPRNLSGKPQKLARKAPANMRSNTPCPLAAMNGIAVGSPHTPGDVGGKLETFESGCRITPVPNAGNLNNGGRSRVHSILETPKGRTVPLDGKGDPVSVKKIDRTPDKRPLKT